MWRDILLQTKCLLWYTAVVRRVLPSIKEIQLYEGNTLKVIHHSFASSRKKVTLSRFLEETSSEQAAPHGSVLFTARTPKREPFDVRTNEAGETKLLEEMKELISNRKNQNPVALRVRVSRIQPVSIPPYLHAKQRSRQASSEVME